MDPLQSFEILAPQQSSDLEDRLHERSSICAKQARAGSERTTINLSPAKRTVKDNVLTAVDGISRKYEHVRYLRKLGKTCSYNPNA